MARLQGFLGRPLEAAELRFERFGNGEHILSPPSGPMIWMPAGSWPGRRGTGITTAGRWHTVASAIQPWTR